MMMEVHCAYVEAANVGVGLGGGFENTLELKVMKYEEDLNGPDGNKWKVEFDNEHEQIVSSSKIENTKRY